MEKSLSPGSQTFEAGSASNWCKTGLITQDEALANADSATNLLWLLNNGPDSKNARHGGAGHRRPPRRRRSPSSP